MARAPESGRAGRRDGTKDVDNGDDGFCEWACAGAPCRGHALDSRGQRSGAVESARWRESSASRTRFWVFFVGHGDISHHTTRVSDAPAHPTTRRSNATGVARYRRLAALERDGGRGGRRAGAPPAKITAPLPCLPWEARTATKVSAGHAAPRAGSGGQCAANHASEPTWQANVTAGEGAGGQERRRRKYPHPGSAAARGALASTRPHSTPLPAKPLGSRRRPAPSAGTCSGRRRIAPPHRVSDARDAGIRSRDGKYYSE